jgi:ribosomal-protein-alanine N-acetyltransferase
MSMDEITIPPELSAADVCLRPLSLSDAEAIYKILSDPESMKYWSDQPIKHVDEASEVLRKDLESDAKGNSLCWAVTLKDQDELIGKCILFSFDRQNQRAEIGYLLNRKYWRQGLMHQALVAVINYAFNTLKLHRIEADSDPKNVGSLAILEKLGFQREGLFRERWRVYDRWDDSVMLGLLSSEWSDD